MSTRTERIFGTAQTTDDTTWVTLFQISIATSAEYVGLLLMVVFRDAATGHGGHRIAVGSIRNDSGTLTSVGVGTVQSSSDSGLTGATRRWTISGTTIICEVKGVQSVTLDWFGGLIDSAFHLP